MSNAVSVLAAGVPASSAYALVDDIRGASTSEAGERTWRISNRYYDAEISFRVSTDVDRALDAIAGCPAVILLVDPLLALDVRCLERLDSEDIDVSLVVGRSASGKPLADDQRQRWDELCLEHGFEFVDLAEASLGADEVRGAVGIERVREALQAHAWPSATPASRSRSAHPSAFEDEFAPFVSANQSADAESVDRMRDYIFASPPPSATSDSFLAPDEFPSDAADGSGGPHFDLGSTIDRLRALRIKADTMDEPTRRAFAETVSIAFASHLSFDDIEA